MPNRDLLTDIIKGWLKCRRTDADVLLAAKDATFKHLAAGIDMVRNADGDRDDQKREIMAWRLGKNAVIDKLRYWMSNGATVEDVSRDASAIKQAVYAIERSQVALLKIFVEEQKVFGSTPPTKFLDETITEYFLWSDWEDE